MKKYLIGLLVTLSALFTFAQGVLANVNDYEMTPLSCVQEQVEDSYELNADILITKNFDINSGTLMLVYYDENGAAIDVDTCSLKSGFPMQQEQSKIYSIEGKSFDKPVKAVKAMIWDEVSKLTPLAEAVSLEPDFTKCAEFTGWLTAYIYHDLSIAELSVRESIYSTKTRKYSLAPNETKVYVNGRHFATLDDSNFTEIASILMAAEGNVVLCQNPSAATEEYNKIFVDIYGFAKVSDVVQNTSGITVRLTSQLFPSINGFAAMGNAFTVYNEDLAAGHKLVSVTRNGERSTISSLQKGDIVAIKSDVSLSVDISDEVTILATNNTVTGMYLGYDDVEGLYEIDGKMYEASNYLPLRIGATYIFALDPFGRLFSAEEDPSSINYAIIEKYNDVSLSGNSSEYDFIDVVTLTGEAKRLYIDNTTSAMVNVQMALQSIRGYLSSNGIDSFIDTDLSRRVIEYNVKPSTGRVVNLSNVTTTPFSNTEYTKASNTLGDTLLSANTRVLDASEYVEKWYSATVADYKMATLADLSENVGYSGFLIHQNSKDEYEFVVLTIGSTKRYAIVEKYNDASESGSGNDYVDVIMPDGSAERLYIDEETDASAAIASLSGGVTDGGVTDFTGTAPDGRVIEYNSLYDCITNVNKASVTSFTNETYNSSTNALGTHLLADGVTVLNAAEYVDAGSSATVDNYIEYSLSQLVAGTEYSGFLLSADKDGKYEHLIITDGPEKYVPAVNYAIVEKYNDVSISGNSSEFDFIDVVTLDGEAKKLYIDNTIPAMTNASTVIQTIKGSALNARGIENFTGTNIANRVIEYTVKASTGRVDSIAVAETHSFTAKKYNPATNRLDKPLSADAKVLNASQYLDLGAAASVSDYKMLSLSSLVSNVNYSGFLVNKSNNHYSNVVLTYAGPKYHGLSDFAVAAQRASTSSGTIVNDEDVYTLRVMKNGASTAEELYISPSAIISYANGGSYVSMSYYQGCYNLDKGSAFFYTVDDYGFVDRIDIVFQGGKTFDQFRDAPVVNTPDTQMLYNVIELADWYVNPDKNGLHPNNELIQIFAAPVLQTAEGNVSFSAMGTDYNGAYIDTNVEYWYGIAPDANIYYYDMSETAPTNYMAFSKGQFTGIDLSEVSWDGKAYITDIPGETNFDGVVEVAFVMVVDDMVTNALIISEAGGDNTEYLKSTSYVNLTESKLTIKEAGKLRAEEYKLTQPHPYSYSGGTDLYVNDNYYMTISTSNIYEAQDILRAAHGDITVCENPSVAGEYNKIMIDFYGLAMVNQVTASANQVVVRLSSQVLPYFFTSMGNQFTVYTEELASGDKVVTVTKNGVESELSALAKGDIVAIKYDMNGPVDQSKEIEILATDKTVTGMYTRYDDANDKYEISGVMYEAARSLWITRGTTYTFALDPFGRLFSFEENASSKNYAIVEKYNDVSASGNSSEYDFLDVVTLKGEKKRLYIDSTSFAMSSAAGAICQIKGSYINANGIENFTGTPLAGRVIEYSVKTSTGRVNQMTVATTYSFGTPTPEKYNSASNRLGKPLAATTTVLDASAYMNKGPSATAADYKASSLSALSEKLSYRGFLVHQNSYNLYEHVVLTAYSPVYHGEYDFVVAAEDAGTYSATIVDGEVVYRLRVMKDGNSTPEYLYISPSAIISFANTGSTPYDQGCRDLRKGSAFFYTVDDYGFVDRIDIVLQGSWTFDQYRDFPTVCTPDSQTISVNDWYVDVNNNGLWSTNELIQLFVAPVVTVNNNKVIFGEIRQYYNGSYVDTNVEYDYDIATDANIYKYNMALDAPINHTAFTEGTFRGINLRNTSAEGYAYLCDIPNEHNFDGELQVAFVMVVDGEITNALIIDEYMPGVLDGDDNSSTGGGGGSSGGAGGGSSVIIPSDPATTPNYAIVEKYNDVSLSGNASESDFIDVVTLDGVSKRLYIDSTSVAMSNAAAAIQYIKGSDLNSSGIENFAGTNPAGRVIEYSVKASTGRVNNIAPVSTVSFGGTTPEKYNSATNKLYKYLADDAVVLDAATYMGNGASATANDYNVSSLSALSEKIGYAGFLVHQNADNSYQYVVITVAGAKYSGDSDFAVAAATASRSSGAIVNDEDVYTLRVMMNGSSEAEVLNIAMDAKVYYNAGQNSIPYAASSGTIVNDVIKKGSAFFYTVDKDGLVNRIDVVFEGGKTFDAYRDAPVVNLPDTCLPNVIMAYNWFNTCNDNYISGVDETVQLFAAPVILATDTAVSFSKMGTDSWGAYVDTNYEYVYGIASDANIYYYDMSASAPTNYTAFSNGRFSGISLSDTDPNGKAYIVDIPGEYNFDGLLQVAFVMVVDGKITNALIIGE